jgi:hypothetical protein
MTPNTVTYSPGYFTVPYNVDTFTFTDDSVTYTWERSTGHFTEEIDYTNVGVVVILDYYVNYVSFDDTEEVFTVEVGINRFRFTDDGLMVTWIRSTDEFIASDTFLTLINEAWEGVDEWDWTGIDYETFGSAGVTGVTDVNFESVIEAIEYYYDGESKEPISVGKLQEIVEALTVRVTVDGDTQYFKTLKSALDSDLVKTSGNEDVLIQVNDNTRDHLYGTYITIGSDTGDGDMTIVDTRNVGKSACFHDGYKEVTFNMGLRIERDNVELKDVYMLINNTSNVANDGHDGEAGIIISSEDVILSNVRVEVRVAGDKHGVLVNTAANKSSTIQIHDSYLAKCDSDIANAAGRGLWMIHPIGVLENNTIYGRSESISIEHVLDYDGIFEYSGNTLITRSTAGTPTNVSILYRPGSQPTYAGFGTVSSVASDIENITPSGDKFLELLEALRDIGDPATETGRYRIAIQQSWATGIPAPNSVEIWTFNGIGVANGWEFMYHDGTDWRHVPVRQ